MSVIPSQPDDVDAHTRERRSRRAEALVIAPGVGYASASRLQDLIDMVSDTQDFAGRDRILAKLRSRLAQVERVARELARQADEAAASAPEGTRLEQLAGDPSRILYRRDGRLYGIIQGVVTDKDGRTHPARPGEVPTSYQAITPGRVRFRLGGCGGPTTTSKRVSTLQEAVNHITQRADAMTAETRKDVQAAREGGLFDVPGMPRVRAPKEARPWEPKPGEVGGPITFEGGRTGQVWADAPYGGKWVIPDQRREGEAYAIYVGRHGRVDPTLSSRKYQQQWLRARDQR